MSLLTRVTGSVLFLTNNCYCKLTPNSARVKFCKRLFSKVLGRSERWCSARCVFSGPPRLSNSYIVYDKLLAQRREEAKRSIVVQIFSFNQCSEVYAYCSQFGNIIKIYHYTSSVRSEKNFVLIEFEKEEHVDAVLSSSTHIDYDNVIPVQSTLLRFRNLPSQKGKTKNGTAEQIKLTRNSCRSLDDNEIIRKLLCAQSVSDQIMTLYDSTKLNDAGTRLRFYTAYQIQKCYQSMLPNIAVLPFGSSVNGFGKQNCDLDLSLVLDTIPEEKAASRLIFQTKSISYLERHQIRRVMEVLAETMSIFLPGISNVKKILEARVPIIKFDHTLSGMQCDLAMSNMTAYYMSELLYIYGEIDWRVRPLTFVIRRWAKNLLLVNKNNPGPWITNFPLTLMVIFFLQQKEILPDIATLKSKASKEDVKIVDTYVDCTFLRDIKKLPKTSNNDSLETLLLDFFLYYSNFDFATQALSLKVGKPIPKPEYSSLYICNPLEVNLNVSKNVNSDQVDRIVMAMREAAHEMENLGKKSSEKWGLLGLLSKTNWLQSMQKKTPLDFKTLFEKEEEVLSSS